MTFSETQTETNLNIFIAFLQLLVRASPRSFDWGGGGFIGIHTHGLSPKLWCRHCPALPCMIKPPLLPRSTRMLRCSHYPGQLGGRRLYLARPRRPPPTNKPISGPSAAGPARPPIGCRTAVGGASAPTWGGR